MKEESVIFVGVDGGGSGCRAVADLNGEIVRVTGGSANVATDFSGAMMELHHLMERCLAPLRAENRRIVVHMGLAGVVDARAAMRVRKGFETDFEVTVSDDSLTALIGALGDEDGAIVALGTGSFIAIQRGDEQIFRGGWGFEIGDQASAAWLGRRVLTETALVLDRLGKRTDLAEAVIDNFAGDAGRMVEFAKTASPMDYGTLARLVTRAAAADDQLGLRLMREGVQYIVDMLDRNSWSSSEKLCFSKGLGDEYIPFMPDRYRPYISAPMGTALDGALHIARQNYVKKGKV